MLGEFCKFALPDIVRLPRVLITTGPVNVEVSVTAMLLAPMFPVTDSPPAPTCRVVSVPTDVMFGCATPTTLPAKFAKFALAPADISANTPLP